MDWRHRIALAALALALLAAPGFGVPTIVHDPIAVAPKGQPLGLKATVRDAGGRVESVSLFYASSRGMTPFRASMTHSGAGVWYGTIPGHLMGPGAQMLYYIQAENADGESRETDWQTVKLVEAGVAPEAIPAASEVAKQAEKQAQAQAAATTAKPAPAPRSGKSRYLIPAAVIVGGAVAVGGAYAIISHDSGDGGGGGGGGGTVTNGNFGGNYEVCFAPTAASNTTDGVTNAVPPVPSPDPVCESGLVNVYVREGGTVEIVGLWGPEVLTASLRGQTFSAVKEVGPYGPFPAARLIVSGEFAGDACDARVDGYSTNSQQPGNFSGRLETTRR